MKLPAHGTLLVRPLEAFGGKQLVCEGHKEATDLAFVGHAEVTSTEANLASEVPICVKF